MPDPTTFDDALEVLHGRGLYERMPERVQAYFVAAQGEPSRETPKPGDSVFERVSTEIVGRNADALSAAAEAARARGYEVVRSGETVTGEAREVGGALVRQALARGVDGPTCLFWGGETTVTVRGGGRGGRNQEVALAAALALDGAGREVVFLSGGTDGIDGPTDAAGAWATPATVPEARARGLDPEAALSDNDAYPFFDALGALLRPGPTHTNVMDVSLLLIG